jgi:hypothetical protein
VGERLLRSLEPRRTDDGAVGVSDNAYGQSLPRSFRQLLLWWSQLQSRSCSASLWLPIRWRLAPQSSNGTVPRNYFRGFAATQVNMAIRRDFRLNEGLNLQFRAETFNVLNHPIFGYIDPTLSDSTFGQATKTLNQSLGTVASQYQQGGPRSMQFALKLLF